jgi:hypothetical protein
LSFAATESTCSAAPSSRLGDAAPSSAPRTSSALQVDVGVDGVVPARRRLLRPPPALAAAAGRRRRAASMRIGGFGVDGRRWRVSSSRGQRILFLPRARPALSSFPRRMPSRREGMQFCISSLLRRKFASLDAFSVGGCCARAQLPAGGKNAFASRCWT